jgi:hypothetical protein
VRQALEALAQGHDAQKKGVSLSFAGKGEREVREEIVARSVADTWEAARREWDLVEINLAVLAWAAGEVAGAQD